MIASAAHASAPSSPQPIPPHHQATARPIPPDPGHTVNAQFVGGEPRRLTAPIRNNTPRFPRLTGTKTLGFRMDSH